MTHHVLRDKHRNKFAAVVNREGQPNHLRRDHRAPTPRLDRPAIAALKRLFNLALKTLIDEWTFLN
jgi:hypothetical protein